MDEFSSLILDSNTWPRALSFRKRWIVAIYTDSCALNRLTDDQSQLRVQREAIAVGEILMLVQRGSVLWIGSSLLRAELARNPNADKRRSALALVHLVDEMKTLDRSILRRGRELALAGFGKIDALHLAIAESANADWLISTDDRFLRKIQRRLGKSPVAAANPVNWRREVNL